MVAQTSSSPAGTFSTQTASATWGVAVSPGCEHGSKPVVCENPDSWKDDIAAALHKFLAGYTASDQKTTPKAVGQKTPDLPGEIAEKKSESRSPVQHETPAQIAEQKAALNNLGQSFGLIAGGKNLISKADLQAAADGKFPPTKFGATEALPLAKEKAQQAALYFLAHPDKLNAVDVALGKNIGNSRIDKIDGLISRDDIATYMNKMPLSKTEIDVVRTLQESKSASVKPFSFNEQSLMAMANDAKATPKQREAAQYVLDNPAFRARLDTANQVASHRGTSGFGDGVIAESDLKALLSRPEAKKPVRNETPAQIAEQKAALNNFGQSFDLIAGGKNLISKADLQAAAHGIFPPTKFGETEASPKAKEKAQQAALYFLAHPDKFNAVDNAWGKNTGNSRIDKVDGLVAREDIATRMNQMPLSKMEIDVVRTLQESKSASVKSFSFNEQSLMTMASDAKATPKQREAAKYVLDNPAFRARLDTANQVASHHGTGGFGDGKIVDGDLTALLNRPEAKTLA